MKKKLFIIDRTIGSLEQYKNQLKDIFEDQLEIETLLVENIQDKAIRGDFFVFPSYSIFYEVDESKLLGKILFSERTILLESFEQVVNLDHKDTFYLVDESKQMAAEIIYILRRMLHKKLNLKPKGINEIVKEDHNRYISMGYDLNDYGVDYINVGNPVISIGSIIEIARQTETINMLKEKDISRASGELINYESGYEFLRKEANKLKGIMDNFFSFFEDGYFVFNKDGLMTFYNEVGIKMLRLNPKNDINIKDVLSVQKIDEIFIKKRTIVDEVLKIRGENMIISVFPNINSGEFFGVTAIVKEYEKTERRHLEIRKKMTAPSGHYARYSFEDIIGESPSIQKTIQNAKRMAKSDASILIEGETGTGKELIAQAVHKYSKRAQYPFVAVNFGALPINILESELFGYEEGAFTGAKSGGKLGLFEMAHKGTIFLDEIGEMPLEVQTKLLRVLQEKEVIRLGSDKVIVVDIRVVAATNKNLYKMVQEKTFREDLYYRLNVLPIRVEPLRDRKDDILLLLNHFKNIYHGHYDISKEAQAILLRHHWRGNIRELRNYVEYFKNTGKVLIEVEDLPFTNIAEQSIEKEEMAMRHLKDFEEVAGVEKEKYKIVLEILYKAYEKNERIGRQKISSDTKRYIYQLSEQEVRRLLNNLEELGLVKKHAGRKGSEITQGGVRLLDSLKGL